MGLKPECTPDASLTGCFVDDRLNGQHDANDEIENIVLLDPTQGKKKKNQIDQHKIEGEPQKLKETNKIRGRVFQFLAGAPH
jgi:hypothetical protein